MTSSNSPTDVATEISKPAEADLLHWLEGFAERLKGRTNAVADQVQQVVEAMDTVELNLQNTFNSFRCLSSSQFVENHVYEEDETDLVTIGMSKKGAKRPSMPTESYEDEILPRYKDAVAFAWAAFQRGGLQDDQRSVQPGSRNKVQRDPREGERIQILPHIIGSEEFTRDIHCGLADLRYHDPESDTDVESDRAGLAAEPSGSGILFEGDISGTDSDAFDSQEEGTEPAVSAALDFKAMLEAALRNPSLPYDGGTSDDSLFGEFADNKFSLPNLTNDNLNNSPRTISTMVDIIGRTMSTMDESKDKLRDSASEQSNANVASTKVPLATEPLQILDDPTPSSTIEELLKKPLNPISQAMLNQEFKRYIDSNNGNRQLGTGDLGHVPIIPGLLNDEARDTRFMTKKDSVVPNSNTGPTIPEGLFEEQLSSKPIQHTRTESQSSNSLDGSQIQPLTLPSLDVVPKSSNQESQSVLINFERNESEKFQSASSLTNRHASSSISSVSNVMLGSQLTGQLPIRGGLFDDDEEDEDAGDLFGGPAPRVDSQSVLRPWASQSSKGLFDDFAKERDGATQSSDEAGSSQEVQRNSDVASVITSQYKGESGHGPSDLLKQPGDSTIGQTYSGSTHVDLVTSFGSKESVPNYRSDVIDNKQLPVQPTDAAAVRSSVPSLVDSDDESWSSSESGVEEAVQGQTFIQQPIHQDPSMTLPSSNESGAKEFQSIIAEGILDLMPESIIPETEHLSQSLSFTENTMTASTESTMTVSIHGEEENAVFSSQTAPVAPPAYFPPISRSFSSTETSPVLKISVKPAENPLLQSKILDLSDAEASDSSDSADSASSSSDLHGIGQRQILQNRFSGTSTLPENLRPSTRESTSFVNEAPSSSAQISGKNLIPEDSNKVSITNPLLPVKELGRPTTRTFTSLFDDDDDDNEEDLFGQRPPKHQGALFPRTGQPGVVLSSAKALPISLGQGRIVETGSSLTTQDVHPQLQPASNPSSDIPFPSHSTSVENKDGDSSSTAKSGSKISSLLFGDDEEDEDALFGPLGGRTSRGLKSGKAGSIFGDVNLPSNSSSLTPKRGNNLFDD